ncbi:spartin-like isoform X2 [Varroa destructor]|nr:spartin-like isoform X2 [Varroa destructor]XP_022647241.1 spartin-like isoform X2 [Varroa destructor]
MAAGSVHSMTEMLEQLKEAQQVAFDSAKQGTIYENNGRVGEALHMYYNAMRHLNIGLSVWPCRSSVHGAKWDEAVKIRNELAHIKEDVRSRINFLVGDRSSEKASQFKYEDPTSRTRLVSNTPPPYGEEATVHNNRSSMLRNNGDACSKEVLQDAPSPTPSAPPDSMMIQTSARQLVHIPGGVQVFHTTSSGEVSVQSDPTELFVFTRNPAYCPISAQTVSWLQVGEFTYSLVPGKSPVLKTGFGAYMFPDVSLYGGQSSSVALVFSANVTDELRALFDKTLNDYACFQEDPKIQVPEEPSFGQKVSDGIIATSELINRGLIRGAQATSVALSYGADKLRQHMTPEQRALAVDPRVQTGLKVARATSHVTCKVTGFVVSAVGDMTCALGKRIARTLAPTEVVDGVASNGTLNDALLIAGGGVAGFGTVFMGLENAARVLAKSITENTVTLVHHKYGEDAGEVIGDAMYSIGNFALTVNNVANLGVRGIAKRTAKEAGKAMLQEYARTGQSQQPEDFYTVESPDSYASEQSASKSEHLTGSETSKRS